MKKIFCIGEILIDFIPFQKKALQDVTSFERDAAGARAVMLTKIANDHFGDYRWCP
ncbi:MULTISPECIES: hypothetical protein [Bacillus]|uniref:hypothetical protein n=1 Tax=Bacillus TaxID=1386 RepID=UPI0022489B68|nr:hypothetical protein [Bacillus sp. ChL18]MCX2811163.1 hypothetical protein [Bacillus sp. ChL18]